LFLKVCAYERSQIYLVDDEKIGAGNTGAALARNFFAFRDIDHIDDDDASRLPRGVSPCRNCSTPIPESIEM
jgi:hypothetical protein